MQNADACVICAILDSLTPSLTYFLNSAGSKCKNPILGQMGGQIVTAAHKTLAILTYFMGQNHRWKKCA